MRLTVGIIGAGVSGLTIARGLRDRGAVVTVLDKGRRPGGRASSREVGGLAFDHGSPYVSLRDPEARRFLEKTIPKGVLAPWPGSFARLEGEELGADPDPDDAPRLVGIPGMGAACRALAEGIDVRNGVRIAGLSRSPEGWRLVDSEGVGRGPFDWVVSTAPPPQSFELLDGLGPIAGQVGGVVMLPCFSLMIAPREGAPGLPFDGIRCDHPVIGWAANEHRKPGRPIDPTLVIQSGHPWADSHRSDDPIEVARLLKEAASGAFGLDLDAPRFEAIHRWLYASPGRPIGAPCLIDPEHRLAASGDWCPGGGIEGALISGLACARAVIEASC
jgi:predicted NAD/FAD-dependent oxidoreductase